MLRASSSHVVGIALAVSGVLLGALPAAAETSAPKRSFRVTIDSTMILTGGEVEQTIKADTTMLYSRQRVGQTVTVWFDEMAVRAVSDGQVIVDTRMNRDRVVLVDNGVTREVLADEAPAEVRQQLRDSFGGPLCEMTVDEDGIEGEARILAGPGAKSLVDNGLISGTRLFHVRFPAEARQWDSANEVSMGSGAYARGTLHYEKVGPAAGGRTLVRVSGVLTHDDSKVSGTGGSSTGPSMRNVRYVVTGEQVYDHTNREWATGSLVMQIQLEYYSGEELLRHCHGTMSVQLETLTR